MTAFKSSNPHFSDFAAMGLPVERETNAFGILAQPPKPIAQSTSAKKYPQMTKKEKVISAMSSPEERAAKKLEKKLAAAKK